MSMKWWTSERIFLLAALFVAPLLSQAQNGYEKRVGKYQSQWEKLIPTHQKIQYAGGMGVVSVGLGWDYGKSNQWETDVLLGYLPRYSTKEAKLTFTLKQNYFPWTKAINDKFSVNLLSCGLYVNTIFNGEFWVNEPDKYPDGYYSFSTKMRFNIYLGQRITLNIPPEKRIFTKSVSLFYEISSNDLYIASAFTNSYLGPKDYLRLSFGLKLQLM